jgi:hypothetical protein
VVRTGEERKADLLIKVVHNTQLYIYILFWGGGGGGGVYCCGKSVEHKNWVLIV